MTHIAKFSFHRSTHTRLCGFNPFKIVYCILKNNILQKKIYCFLHFFSSKKCIHFLERKSFKPVAALFHTGCCPLHLHGMSKMLVNIQFQLTTRFIIRLNSLKDKEANRTDRQTEEKTDRVTDSQTYFFYLCNHT